MKKTAWFSFVGCAVVAAGLFSPPTQAEVSEVKGRFDPDVLRSLRHDLLRDFDRSSSIRVDDLSLLAVNDSGLVSKAGEKLEIYVDLIRHSFEIVDADKEWVKQFDKSSAEEKQKHLGRIAHFIERRLSNKFQDVSSVINVRFRDWRMAASGERMKGEFATYSKGTVRITSKNY